MPQIALVAGAFLLLAYLLSGRTVYNYSSGRVVRGGGGAFCPPDHVPTSLGVAPSWRNVSGLNEKVKFYVDPATGCFFQNNPAQSQRLSPVVILTDVQQIADFLDLNGEPPEERVGVEILGPAILTSGREPSCPVGYKPIQVADASADDSVSIGGLSRSWSCRR